MAKEDEGVGTTGSSQNLQGKPAKLAGMSDEDWEKLDLKAANTIQLCLADEVIYNVMDEEMVTSLWSRLETLYMTKKKSLQQVVLEETIWATHEGMTTMLEHLNFFKASYWLLM